MKIAINDDNCSMIVENYIVVKMAKEHYTSSHTEGNVTSSIRNITLLNF